MPACAETRIWSDPAILSGPLSRTEPEIATPVRATLTDGEVRSECRLPPGRDGQTDARAR